VSKRPLTHILVLSTALLIGAGPYVVRAAGIGPDAGAVANVDMQRVYAESDAKKASDTRVREYGRTMFDRFAQTAQLQFLSAEELSDYSEAMNSEKPTDAEKKKIADLKAESTRRLDENQKLATTPQATLTDKDKERLRILNGYQQQRPQILDRLQKVYQQMVDEEEIRQQRQGMVEVRGIVGKVAKDQGITQVYDATAMVVAPVDLTQQALQKVKKK
jgi:hypothetical protein